MNKTHRQSAVELILLGMVIEQPRSAYEIQKQVEFRNLERWVKMSIPSVYKKVLSMEKCGLIKGEAFRDSRMEKTVYSITAAGRARFALLMKSMAEKPVQLLFDFNAVVAGLNKLPKPEAIERIQEIEAGIVNTTAYISEMQPQREHIPLVGRTIIKQQLYVLQALQKWIKEFKVEFESEA